MEQGKRDEVPRDSSISGGRRSDATKEAETSNKERKSLPKQTLTFRISNDQVKAAVVPVESSPEDFFEADPTDLKAGIEIRNLKKVRSD